VTQVKKYAKAIAAAVVVLAGYLITVIPAAGGLGDVTFVQWLGAVVFVGTTFGVTAGIPNSQPDVLARLDKQGRVVAGEGAEQTTGRLLRPSTPVEDLVPVDTVET
jgi:hypothetical protein